MNTIEKVPINYEQSRHLQKDSQSGSEHNKVKIQALNQQKGLGNSDDTVYISADAVEKIAPSDPQSNTAENKSSINREITTHSTFMTPDGVAHTQVKSLDGDGNIEILVYPKITVGSYINNNKTRVNG